MSNKLTKIQSPAAIRDNALASLVNGQLLLNKSYLSELGECRSLLLANYPEEKINSSLDVRIFKVERIVLENKQSVLESLTAAYNALGSVGYSVFLWLKSDGKVTDVYLGTKGRPKKVEGNEAGKLLGQVFKGHFAGSQLTNMASGDVNSLLYNLSQTSIGGTPSITSVTGIPSLSVEEREHFMQGLEHFIDAAEGQTYQAILLAEPISQHQLNVIQAGYEGVATQLSPLLKQSVSFGENESESIGLSIGESISQSLGTSLSLTQTQGTNESLSNTITHGTNESYTKGTSTSTTSQTTGSKAASGGASLSSIVGAGIGFTIAGPIGPYVRRVLGGVVGSGVTTAFGKSETIGSSESKTVGSSHSESNGVTKGTSESTARGKTETATDTYGTNSNKSINTTLGSSRQITLESVDKMIEQLLKRVDHQLERVDEVRRYGGWNSAAYFISDSSSSSRALASIFLGLMRGDNSNCENFALTTWANEKSKQVLPWLSNLSHPRLKADFANQLGIQYLTPTTLVSSKEMAIQLSLPRRSTSTVSIVEAQAFGRQIQNVDGSLPEAKNAIYLGNIRHLWQTLPQKVELDLNKLTSHLFISGSTGSGKSNTVYQILSELIRHKVPFMVIEPAKGEYKHVFGNNPNIAVFGTNPQHSTLLKINPFRFPEGIHVLEHIDRLIEIFNVCWPMYAAMPAVLKDAMLKAYEKCGWDLDLSINGYQDVEYPSFMDLLHSLEEVVNHSAFSEEVKSNYIGSLVTRVRSLTNGLNGQIFSANEIDNTKLFDENVIVDLSRIGSQETKSLIMGILIMRLNEHRISFSGMNQPLKHVTVLEEAHNILKKTSTEQSSEGANVAGKAVEMLSNAIAEMRTFGEGFIIADQSPNAVDISAIRNTNTKIIMRLPDEADRSLIGKAAGMKDEQLEELSKLPKGVAVIYQNDWLEPVLCEIAHYQYDEEKLYNYKPAKTVSRKQFNLHLARLLLSKYSDFKEEFDLVLLKEGIKVFDIPQRYKVGLEETINRIENSENEVWQEDLDSVKLLAGIFGLTYKISGTPEDISNIVIQRLNENFPVSEYIEDAIRQRIK